MSFKLCVPFDSIEKDRITIGCHEPFMNKVARDTQDRSNTSSEEEKEEEDALDPPTVITGLRESSLLLRVLFNHPALAPHFNRTLVDTVMASDKSTARTMDKSTALALKGMIIIKTPCAGLQTYDKEKADCTHNAPSPGCLCSSTITMLDWLAVLDAKMLKAKMRTLGFDHGSSGAPSKRTGKVTTTHNHPSIFLRGYPLKAVFDLKFARLVVVCEACDKQQV